jgi:hypothetical protein
MKTFMSIILVLHGLIHLMGFIKAFKIANIDQLNMPISKKAGILWLIAALLFLLAFALMLCSYDAWWIFGTLAIILSQALVFRYWSDAKFGTIANLIILVPVIITALEFLPTSFINRYKTEVNSRLTPIHDPSVLMEEEIAHLPGLIKKYLHYTGAVGKPKVHNVRAVFTGSMKQKPDGKWMEISSQQYNFFDDPARLFYVRGSMFGVPFDGFHQFTGDHAIMLIRVANLFTVADARGDKMDQGETVTMFNDMCLLAPATLIDSNIAWEEINDTMVEAIFTNRNHTIAATLHFNASGGLINFVSQDRFMSSDGKEYLNYPWSTPVKSYKEMDGRRVPSYGEAVWQTPEGPFCYGKFNIGEIEYNLSEFLTR